MSTTNTASPPFIVGFYQESTQGGFRDAGGRSLSDILNYNDQNLELRHDYIQVLFPLPERSPINPDAPLITKETRDAFLADANLRDRLFHAFRRMAEFYGFEVASTTEGVVLSPKTNFAKIARGNWLTRFDHNHLRITRIIRCLRILGLESAAKAFFQALQDNASGVSPRSLMYWRRAVERPLHLPPDDEDDNAPGISWLRGSA